MLSKEDESFLLLLWSLLSNRVYLSPTSIPECENFFGPEAELFAVMSVDKSFENNYQGMVTVVTVVIVSHLRR